MALVTATGTWTVLPGLDLADAAKTAPNPANYRDLNLENIKVAGLPELQQFIELVGVGYGIGYQHAKALVYTLMTLEMGRGDQRRNDSYAN
jgi:hypothetical protein